MILAIDFDGTIVKHEFPKIGELMPGAAYTIRRLAAAGHTIIIWTCRNGEYEEAAKKFLEDNNIPYHYINENISNLSFKTSNKIYADVYIDDRNLGGFPGWHIVSMRFLPDAGNLG